MSSEIPPAESDQPATVPVADRVGGAPSGVSRKGMIDWCRSLLASSAIHLTLLAAFAAVATWWELERGTPSPPVSTILKSDPEPVVATPAITVPLVESRKADAVPAAIVPNELQKIVQRQWQQALEESKKLDATQRMQELDRLASRLQATSSSRNVVEMGGWVLKSLNVSQRRAEPEPGDVAPFDHTSAQFLDVRELLKEGRKTGYLAVLVDAAGRRLEEPLDEKSGEELFKMFRLMEKHPLLREVYLSLALPVLDQVLAEMTGAPAAVDTTAPADPIVPTPPSKSPDSDSP